MGQQRLTHLRHSVLLAHIDLNVATEIWAARTEARLSRILPPILSRILSLYFIE